MLPFYIIIHYGFLVHGFVPNPFFFSLVLFLMTGVIMVARMIQFKEEANIS
jgi:energy-coupling factor transporter transmembrane protein EcfT